MSINYSTTHTSLYSNRIIWAAILTILATSLVIIVNVNDSTLLKLPFLFVFVIIIVALWAQMILAYGQQVFFVSKIHISFVLYILISLFSLTHAMNKEIGLTVFAQHASYFILVAAGFQFCATSEGANRIRQSILFLTAAECLVGIAQVLSPSFGGLTEVYSTRNVSSTFGNATYFSGFLIFVIPLLLSEILTVRKFSKRQMLLGVLILVSVYLLIRTESRSSWVAFIISSILFLFLQNTSQKKRLITMTLFVFVLVGIVLLFPSIIERRLSGILESSPTSSVTRRFVIYEGAWRAFLDSPILGHGIGNFNVIIPKYRSPDYWISQSEDIVPHAHNEFLEVLSDTGLLGFLFWMFTIFYCLWTLLTSIKKTAFPERTLFIGYACSIVAVLIDNLGSMSLRTVPVAALFWLIIGLVSRQANVPARTITFGVPPTLRRFRIAPMLCAVVFLLLYGRNVYNDYQSDSAFLRGLQLYWKNQPEAFTYFRESVTFNQNHSQARFYLAANLIQKELYPDALPHLQTLLDRFPYYPKAKLLSAIAHIEGGDTTAAWKEIGDALHLSTDPQTLYYAASFAYRTNNTELEYQYVAARLLQNIASRRNDYTQQGVHRLAQLCIELQKKNECRQLLLRLQETFPNDTTLTSAIQTAVSTLRN
jgi:O-antigen ligase